MARVQIDGLNLHHKFKLKKPFGGGNSFVNRAIKRPAATLGGSALGMGVFGSGLGAGLTDMNANIRSKFG